MVKMYTNAMESIECPICYTNEPTYVVNCGSTVEHRVCDTCEVTMRMKEPATRDGRVLKCPMCRVPEKTTGKRSSFSYEYELSKLYAPDPVPVRPPARAPVHARPEEDWLVVANRIRDLPISMQTRYIRTYPQLAPYFETYNPVIDLVNPRPHRLAVEAAIAEAERPIMRERPPRPAEYHAFCESGNRQAGLCPTRGKTERKCSNIGCNKFVCRSCRQCITH